MCDSGIVGFPVVQDFPVDQDYSALVLLQQ